MERASVLLLFYYIRNSNENKMHARSKMATGSHIMRINRGSWCDAAFRDRDVILSKCKFKNAELVSNFTLVAIYLSLWYYWVMKPTTTVGWIYGIQPEVWKNGGPTLNIKFHEFFVCCWEQRKLPQDLRDAVIISLHKNKGEKSDCANYRGISRLAIARKILARVLVNRLVYTIAAEQCSQCMFRTNRGASGMVFALRLIQEKCRAQNKGVFITFVDLTKAFDTVSRKGL